MDLSKNFKNNGFSLVKNPFKSELIVPWVKEFDRIIIQLKKSGENLNARWGSDLTKDLESNNSEIIHTHNVQSFSALMLSLVQNKELINLVECLIGPNIILHHTKLFLKPPKTGAAFPLHQDWSYFPTKKNSMVAAVVHLSESTEEMGCLRIIPESHKLGKKKNTDGHKINPEIHNKYSLIKAEPIVADLGDVVFFDSRVLHGSMPNISNKSRKTILLQFYSGKDKILKMTGHTNVQLVLRGVNYFATRNNVSNI